MPSKAANRVLKLAMELKPSAKQPAEPEKPNELVGQLKELVKAYQRQSIAFLAHANKVIPAPVLNVPEQEAPVVNNEINVPEQQAPKVENIINIPEQPAPTIDMQIEDYTELIKKLIESLNANTIAIQQRPREWKAVYDGRGNLSGIKEV